MNIDPAATVRTSSEAQQRTSGVYCCYKYIFPLPFATPKCLILRTLNVRHLVVGGCCAGGIRDGSGCAFGIEKQGSFDWNVCWFEGNERRLASKSKTNFMRMAGLSNLGNAAWEKY